MSDGKSDSVSKVFMREAARATPWGLMIIIVVLICLGFINYTGKQLVNYAQENAARTIRQVVTNHEIVEGFRQNVKKGIEYTFGKAAGEFRKVLRDPQLKQDMKEAVEYYFSQSGGEVRVILVDSELKPEKK
ncbi:MAG: hypothetical protein JXR85_01705 [Deltaproteobacteria bacterium]|nr:hypothetical protein [Deltaproteobacteria bacterium]